MIAKTIEIFMMDGTTDGRWEVKLSNWNILAYKISRDDFKKCSDIPELGTPGVYFLFGKEDDADEPFIYVGEANNVFTRVQQTHTFEKGDTYWTETVAFVASDNSLDKAKVKYLEKRFYQIAVDADRYIVKNGTTPASSSLPKSVQAALEEFIINVKLIMPAIGHKALEPKPSSNKNDSDSQDDLLYFSRNKGLGGKGICKIAGDGFWVLKGSYIYPKIASYVGAGIKKAREKHSADIDKNGILQQDVHFGSPSYAAAFISGKNANGLVEWKNKDGISLKDLNSRTPTMHKKTDITSKRDELHLAGKKANAKGVISDNGFTVLKGSEFCKAESEACPERITTKRNELISNGKIKDNKFTENVEFNSPSAAAGCILGSSVNGKMIWLYPDGESIKDKEGK